MLCASRCFSYSSMNFLRSATTLLFNSLAFGLSRVPCHATANSGCTHCTLLHGKACLELLCMLSVDCECPDVLLHSGNSSYFPFQNPTSVQWMIVHTLGCKPNANYGVVSSPTKCDTHTSVLLDRLTRRRNAT